MSVALVIRHAKAHAPYYVVMRGQKGRTTFFHIISLTVRFSKKESYEQKICVLIFSANSV